MSETTTEAMSGDPQYGEIPPRPSDEELQGRRPQLTILDGRYQWILYETPESARIRSGQPAEPQPLSLQDRFDAAVKAKDHDAMRRIRDESVAAGTPVGGLNHRTVARYKGR